MLAAAIHPPQRSPIQSASSAKDGADLPAHQIKTSSAKLDHFAPGEIIDVEFTPRAAGTLTLRHGLVGFPGDPTKVAMRVR